MRPCSAAAAVITSGELLLAASSVTAATLNFYNGSAKDQTFVCSDRPDQVAAADSIVEVTAGKGQTKLSCTKPGAFAVEINAPDSPETTKTEAGTTTTPKCTAEDLIPQAQEVGQAAFAGCGEVSSGEVKLCLSVFGSVIGSTPLISEGQTVHVYVLARDGFSSALQLEAIFEATQLSKSSKLNLLDQRKSADQWFVVADQRVPVKAQGKLQISLGIGDGSATMRNQTDGVKSCSVAPDTHKRTFNVSGHYYFSAGLMVAYTHLQGRQFSRQTGGDGVTRIGQQDSAGLDYVVNVFAYPWGVTEDTRIVPGLVFGTSIASLGKRWYVGTQLASPIGFGVVAGAAVSVVPKLDEPLRAGQPFSGDNLATHDVVEPTWFVGINLETALFEAAFSAVLGDKKKEGSE